MDLGEMISKRRKAAGITIDELAFKSKVPKGTLNKIINGVTKDPQIETVKAIARALHCSLDDFDDTPRACRLSAEESLHIKKYRSLDKYGKELLDLVLDKEIERCTTASNNVITQDGTLDFPSKISLRISLQPVSAGRGIYLGPEAFEKMSVLDTPKTQRTSFAVRVSGDSMEPLYQDGDIILVAQEEVSKGDIAVVTLNGEGYVKRIGDGELLSLNHKYPPIPLNDSVRVNGRVIGKLEPSQIVE